MVAILPWLFSKGCRPYLITLDFARGGDIMIGNEGTGGIRLYCRLVHCRMVLRITPTEGVVVGVA